MKEHVYAFDSLRGIFAIFVAYSHFFGSLYGWNYYPFKGAFLAVDFFFILSGVVLTLAYKEKFLTGKLNFLDFILIRLFRLYPLHVITMLITAVIMSFSIVGGVIYLNNLPFDNVLDHTILNLLLLNGIGIPPLGWSFNDPSWSISVEYWVGCLLLPILLNIRVEYKILLAFIFYCFVFYMGGLSQNNNLFGFINVSVLRGVSAFLLGNSIYEISLIQNKKKALMNDKYDYSKGGGIGILILTLLQIILLIVVMYYNFSKSVISEAKQIFCIFSIFILLLSFLCFPNTIVFKILNKNRIFLFLGKISFSIYLIHTSLIWFFDKIYYVELTDKVGMITKFAIFNITLLCISYLSFLIVEKKLYFFLRSIINK